jgi:Mg/Co/Ni transporter MgtE
MNQVVSKYDWLFKQVTVETKVSELLIFQALLAPMNYEKLKELLDKSPYDEAKEILDLMETSEVRKLYLDIEQVLRNNGINKSDKI